MSPSVYPAQYDALTRYVDGLDKPKAQDRNDEFDVIEAIEGSLGLTLSGSVANLATRIAVHLADNGTLKDFRAGVSSIDTGQAFFETGFSGTPRCFAFSMGGIDTGTQPVIHYWDEITSNNQQLNSFRVQGGVATSVATVAWLMWVDV